MLIFTFIFLIALLLYTAIDFYLDQRHMRSIVTHRDVVPERFADAISLESHQKAADYTMAKMKLATWSGLYGLGYGR